MSDEYRYKIAVLMPVFNNVNYVEKALNSVFNQTIKADWVVVLDDRSNDGTFEYLQKLEKDKKILLIRNGENMGIGYGRKRLVASAIDCQFIAYLSGDDEWEPNFLEEMIPLAEKHPKSIIFCGAKMIDEKENVMGDSLPPEFKSNVDFYISCLDAAKKDKMFVNFSSLIIPKVVFDKINFRRELRFGEDLMFLYEAILNKIKFVIHRKALVRYRIHSKMTTQEIMGEIKQNNGKIREWIKEIYGKEV